MRKSYNRAGTYKMQTFHIIGISDSRNPFFSPEAEAVIKEGKVFSGGKRHHEIVASRLPAGTEWIDITVPLEKVFERYRPYPQIVVFASGDPLFFGFANTVRRMLPDAAIKLYPTFNSLQLLAHRLLLPYQDMRIVSLTGRKWDGLDKALIEESALIGVLTDREKTPAAIAGRMLDYGYDNYRMSVGELLGNEEQEQVRTCTLQEAKETEFRFPNNLILQRTNRRPRLFGIPDQAFSLLNGRTKMITKRPVRLLDLSMLDLRERTSFWDIGFCTGSVSIEAKLQFPHLQITAFERREEGRTLMEQNSRRFGTPGITALIGDFMETDLASLPRPDAVFIGGHGGQLIEMLEKLNSVLLPGGTIVFNSVSEESKRLFQEGIQSIGKEVTESLRLQTDTFNAIEIMKAI